MPYTERQRQIAALIAERGNLSTVEYLLGLARDQREVDGSVWQDLVNSDPQRFQMFIPQWNQRNSWLLFAIDADTHMAVIDYLTVVRDLVARKLVTVLADPKRHVRPAAIVSSLNPPSVSDRDQSALEIDALLQTTSELLNLAIYTERVYALPSLYDFVQRECKSPEELSRDRGSMAQNQLQLQQNRLLSRLSWSMIVIGVLLLLALVLGLFWHLHSGCCSGARDGRDNRFNRDMPAGQRQDMSPTQQNVGRLPATLPTIIHDTVTIHDTLSVSPKHTKKKKRRRHVDMSE